MNWSEFHHPDISWPVVRRRAGTEIMEMLELAAVFLTRGGWGLLNKSCYPNTAAYRNATSRLRRQGLVVQRQAAAETPHLVLSDAGKELLPAYFYPEKHWDRRWNDIWYLLVYDVPEVDRKYRNVFRLFLKRMRMGCLQQSVWITPQDIRPDFDDLSKAANVDAFAYLFESRTVLGLANSAVVEDAWDFDGLNEVQTRYCEVMEKNLESLTGGAYGPDDLTTLLRMSLDAYHAAMVGDPLLPKRLLPANYAGRRVLTLHRKLLMEISAQLEGVSSV